MPPDQPAERDRKHRHFNTVYAIVAGTLAVIVLGFAIAVVAQPPPDTPDPQPEAIPCAAEAAFAADLATARTLRGYSGLSARGHDAVDIASKRLVGCLREHYPPGSPP